VQVSAGMVLVTYRPETFTPIQPAHQERAYMGALGAALLRKGEVDSQGFRRHSKLGKAYLTSEEKLKPQRMCFIFCLYSMHVFNVCFYFSLQAFFPPAQAEIIPGLHCLPSL